MSNRAGRESDKLGRPRLFDDDTERRMIMDATVRILARKGYADMSVAEILAEAELSTTSFYRHFQSKEALLAAVIRRDGESAQRALERAVAAAADPVAALEAWVDGLLNQFFEPKKAARTAIFTTPEVLGSYYRLQGEETEMRRLLAEPLVKVLRAGHRAGALHSPNPKADAASIFDLVSGAAISPLLYPRDRKAARKQAIRFIWPALRIANGMTTRGRNQGRAIRPVVAKG